MTIPNNAQNTTAAIKFIQFVLGPEGRQIFQNCNQPELMPPMCDNASALPGTLKHYSLRRKRLEVVRKFFGTARSFLGRHRLPVVFGILSLLIVLFVLIPLIKIVFLSNKEALWQALQDTTVLKSILLTLYAALITTVAGFLLGVPLALSWPDTISR